MNLRDEVKHEFPPLKNEKSYSSLYDHANYTTQYYYPYTTHYQFCREICEEGEVDKDKSLN